MAKKKATKKPKAQLRSIACKHLVQLDEISNAGNPLCHCNLREFNVSPYNHVCQICKKYVPNTGEITHAEMFIAEAAANFVFDMENIISASDLVEEIEEVEEIIIPKKAKTKAKKKVEEDDDEDDEPVVAEEDDGIVIGHEKEDKEETLEYEDEREEGTGKRHGPTGSEDDEDEDLDGELDDMDDSGTSAALADDSIDISGIDFENDVIAKIKVTGVGDSKKEICPYCQKSKVNVLRHLSKCKRCPPEILKAHAVWKKQKPKKKSPKKSTKKKATKKKATKKKATKAKKK